MSYDNIRFIAYVINTGPQNNLDGSQSYLGIDPPRSDIDARCLLLQRAITTAQGAIPTASPDTLNVFMLPEFFFRGNTGAYTMDDVQYVISQLQQMVAADEWQDWMFVFGTIVGFSASGNTTLKEIYNFSLIQQGGAGSSPTANARVVMKELMSGIDFIADVANPGGMLLGEVAHMKSGPQGSGREKQQKNYDGAGIFELDGVTWGMEICLDHSSDVDRGELSRLLKSPSLPGDNEIQVQLIPSCGMEILPSSIVAETGGYVFNCDGLGSGSTLERVEAGMVAPTVIATSSETGVDDAPVDIGSPPRSIVIDQLYAGGAGYIALYPVLATPPQKTVSGNKVKLPTWEASTGYSFDFSIFYDSLGMYSTVLCRINSSRINFGGNDYYFPLKMLATDNSGKQVAMRMEVRAGVDGYDNAVDCFIQVSDFKFEGIAFQFMNNKDGNAPYTVW